VLDSGRQVSHLKVEMHHHLLLGAGGRPLRCGEEWLCLKRQSGTAVGGCDFDPARFFLPHLPPEQVLVELREFVGARGIQGGRGQRETRLRLHAVLLPVFADKLSN
jgi:hypothetical protein